MSRKKHPEHVNHERWLVSYADFITLLFAFFVVLFASSQSDQKKQVRVAHSMQSAFRNMGVFDAHSRTPPLTDNGGIGADISGRPNPMGLPTMPQDPVPAATASDLLKQAQVEWKKVQAQGKNAASKLPGKAAPPPKTLDEIERDLTLLLAKPIAANSIHLQVGDGGLVISLREAGFFDSGSADVHRRSLPILQTIAAELIPTPYNLRIEGHTDDAPIHTAQFDSNWELSTTRSVRIARIFLQRRDFDPRRLSAAGYAEFHPIASNSTEDGRARNRRVDIVVLPHSSTADAVSSAPLK